MRQDDLTPSDWDYLKSQYKLHLAECPSIFDQLAASLYLKALDTHKFLSNGDSNRLIEAQLALRARVKWQYSFPLSNIVSFNNTCTYLKSFIGSYTVSSPS